MFNAASQPSRWPTEPSGLAARDGTMSPKRKQIIEDLALILTVKCSEKIALIIESNELGARRNIVVIVVLF